MSSIMPLLMLLSFAGGMVWVKLPAIYNYFLPEEVQEVQEKKDNETQIILVPAQQLVKPMVKPKPNGVKPERRKPGGKESDLFCSTTTGSFMDTSL